jgi:hypothetical protein
LEPLEPGVVRGERTAILALRREGRIRAELMRRIERDSDLKEVRFSG